MDGASGDVALGESKVDAVAVVRADGDVRDERVELGEKRAPSTERLHVRLESCCADDVGNLLKESAENLYGDGFLTGLVGEVRDELCYGGDVCCHVFAFFSKDMEKLDIKKRHYKPRLNLIEVYNILPF